MSQQAVLNSPHVQFSRREKRGVVMGLEAIQLVFIGVGAVLAVLLTALAGGFPAGLGIGLLVGGPFMVLGAVRIMGDPLLTWIRRALAFVVGGATGQNSFKAPVGGPSAATTRAEARNARLAKRQGPKETFKPGKPTRMMLPGEAGELLCYQMPSGCALVHDPVSRTITVIAEVSSDAFALLDEGDREIRVQVWSQLLVGFASHPGVVRIQTLDRTVVHPAGDILDYYQQMSAAHGAGAQINPVADASYQELINRATTHTRHDMYLVVTLSVDQLRRQVRGLGGGIGALMDMVHTEMDAVEVDLPLAGARVERWLAPRELAAVIREAYDPQAIEEIGARSGQHAGVNVATAGPMAAEVSWDTLSTDSALHRTYWVSEWPRVEVEAGFMSALTFAGDFVHSVSLLAEPQSTGQALRKIEKEMESAKSTRRLQQKFGQDLTLQQEQEFDDIQRRESELVQGHGEVSFCGFVTISAATKEELAAAEAKLRHGAAQANVELRVLYAQQHQGFLVGALPLGRGVKK